MQRPSSLQTCVVHQQSALAMLRQYLVDQPASGQASSATPGSASLPAFNSQQSTPSSATSSRRRTILQVARESKLNRLIGLTSGLINLEQNSVHQIQDAHFQVESKLSMDLRNTCGRMATREDCLRLDGDLKAIEECLRSLTNQLLLSLSGDNSGSQLEATDLLKKLIQKYLNI
ncbi:leukemia-associated protein 7 [Rhinoraja longicauda]